MAEHTSRRTRTAVIALVVAIGVTLVSACTVDTGVTGIVTANGVARSGILVELFATGTTNRVGATTTANDGTFELNYLSPGDVDVRFAGTLWYDGTPTAGSVPVPVPVVLNTFTDVNADVAIETGGILGRAKTADDQPAVGVTVDAVERASGLVIATTTTDDGGDFVLGALPQGIYLLHYTRASTPPRWYSGANAAGDASPVFVYPGDAEYVMDVHLSVGRSASGTVTDYRNPVAGATVAAFTVFGSFAASTTTGPDGTFAFADLNPASYHLVVYPPAPLHPAAWKTRNDPDPAHAVTIDVTAGDVDAGTSSVTACDPSTFHHGADLSFAHLEGADLTGCDLSATTIDHADMTGADLFRADLTGASLTYVEMQGADLADATITDLYACGIGGDPILPAGWQRLGNTCLAGPTANLTLAPMDGLDLSGVNLTGANLTDTTWQGSILNGTNLTGVNLQGADLSLATLTGVISSGITGVPYRLPAGWSLVGGVLVG